MNVGLIQAVRSTQRAPRLLVWNIPDKIAAPGRVSFVNKGLAAGGPQLFSEVAIATSPNLAARSSSPGSQQTIAPPAIFGPYEKTAQKAAKGRRNPDLNIEAESWARSLFQVGKPKKQALYLDLRQSDKSKNLRLVLLAERRATKPLVPVCGPAKVMNRIAVVDDGLMRSAIATASLTVGTKVRLIDCEYVAADTAIGPFAAQDTTGLKIVASHRRHQDDKRPSKERYVPKAERLCEVGNNGRRSGADWHLDVAGGRTPHPNKIVPALIEDATVEAGNARRAIHPEDIQVHCLVAMAHERTWIHDKGATDEDPLVDAFKTAGYGCPPWKNEPPQWISVRRATKAREILEQMEANSPGSWIRARRYQ